LFDVGFYCAAFPNGIPTKYVVQSKSHNEKDPNQKGNYIFELKTPNFEEQK
jgi:hypothetical protein